MWTRSHTTYESPSQQEMVDYLESKGLKGKDVDMAVAMSHVQSFNLVNEHYSNAFVSPPDDLRGEAIKKAIQAVDLGKLSGSTPLQKAASFMHLVNSDYMLDKLQQDMQYSNLDGQQEILKQIRDRQEKIVPGEKVGKGISGSKTPEQEFYELTPKQRQAFLALKSIQNLPGLNFSTVSIMTEDPDGPFENEVQVDTISEAVRASTPSEMEQDDYMQRLAELDFKKTVNFNERTVKQAIFLPIDDSGSMRREGKQGVVQAVLRFLQEKIDANQIDLWIGRFEHDLVDVEYVTDTMEYYDRVIKAEWGDTDVNNVIAQAQAMIMSGNIAGVPVDSRSRPQLVVINDGQDEVDPTTPYKIPVHAITIDVDNANLKALCKLTGGSFKHFITEEQEYREKAGYYYQKADALQKRLLKANQDALKIKR